jgi:hypothetical protein
MLISGALLVLLQPAVWNYSGEWRGIKAGVVQVTINPDKASSQAVLHMETTGLVGKLYKVKSDYTSTYDGSFCSSGVTVVSAEGSKRRESSVVFQQPPGSARLMERDPARDAVIEKKTINVPPCVHDLMASLSRLRSMKLEVGKSFELPLSDGRKSVSARVEVQKAEHLRVHSETYKTVQLEAFLYNGVFYRRKARLLLWISDDERRLPVRIQIQQPFHIGTITLDLEKQ